MSKNMKTILMATVSAVLLASAGSGLAQTFSTNKTENAVIPDRTPDVGPGLWASQIVLSPGTLPVGFTITNVTVSLDISGGWNGDLYGYLMYNDGVRSQLLTLLDRPGYSGTGAGYGNAGLAINITDTAANPLENYQSVIYNLNGNGQLTGDWQAQASLASTFFNMGVAGTWTLVLGDMAEGDQSTVVNWGLMIESVPEPSTLGLIGLGVLLLGGRRWLARRPR